MAGVDTTIRKGWTEVVWNLDLDAFGEPAGKTGSREIVPGATEDIQHDTIPAEETTPSQENVPAPSAQPQLGAPLLTAVYVNGSNGIQDKEMLLQYVGNHPEMALTNCYINEYTSGIEQQENTGRDDGGDNNIRATAQNSGMSPALDRLIRDVKCGKIQCVVAANLADLGGSTLMAVYYIRNYFKYLNVRFISVKDNFDSDREADLEQAEEAAEKMAADIRSRNQSKMRCEKAIKRASEPGAMPNGTAPYGYLVSEESGQKCYVADPDTSPYVRMIFKWSLLGLSCGQIAERMALIGAPTPGQLRNGRAVDPSKWDSHAVLKIIRNPNYVGDVCLGRMRQALYKSEVRRQTSPDEWTVRKNAHEPLVTREDFEEVQRRVLSNCKRPGKKRNDEESETARKLASGELL